MPRDPCDVCQLPDQLTSSVASGIRTECRRCGKYDWRTDAPLSGRAARQVKMSGYIREQNDGGIVPLFTPELVRMVERMPLPRLRHRCDRLLTAIVRAVGYSMNNVPAQSYFELDARSYCANDAERATLISILLAEGLVQHSGGLHLTPKGLLEAEERRSPTQNSAQGFVAMSFDHSMDDAYSLGFRLATEDAGYRSLRIDSKEHVNGISDEIIAEIRRSRFLVADYTHLNNGVYFEAGVAVGLGITVIPTCRKDDLGKLHFDIRHINTLSWETPEDLRASLARRISAVLGDGPLKQFADRSA